MAILLKFLFELIILLVILVLIQFVLIKTGLIFFVKKSWRAIQDWFHVYQILKVPEFNSESTTQQNHLYSTVHLYLSRLASTEDGDSVNLLTGKKANDIVIGLEPNMVVCDNFLGARVSWINEHEMVKDGAVRRSFVLKIRKSDKRRILRPYLQHIHVISDEFEVRKKELRLHLNVSGNELNDCHWKSIPFTHPSTFDTIAIEEELKSKIKSDLDSFLKAKQYYHRLGRVWKRSFLLYGPSGTGKSSFVAAVARYIGFDVYDMDMSRIKDDSDLKLLLLQTAPRSIILVEDLDRILRDGSKISLSGIMNFMDGILNSCAEERVMIFTMNSKENVDPALLRPGRIDVHINFQLCDFNSFKIMANSYLGVKDHRLFAQVEDIFQQGASLSPAEVGELMIMNRSSPSRAIKSVISALHTDGEGRGKWIDTPSRKSGENSSEQEKVYCTEGVPAAKELKKLYSMLTRSNRKIHSGEMNQMTL